MTLFYEFSIYRSTKNIENPHERFEIALAKLQKLHNIKT